MIRRNFLKKAVATLFGISTASTLTPTVPTMILPGETVPAMVLPGEFVIHKRIFCNQFGIPESKYFSILKRLNS